MLVTKDSEACRRHTLDTQAYHNMGPQKSHTTRDKNLISHCNIQLSKTSCDVTEAKNGQISNILVELI